MGVLIQTLDRAISNNWIPAGDKQAIENRIKEMADKYGFDPDDFATFTHIESYGMNPRADKIPGKNNSCVGIIQFCSDTNNIGTKTIGGRKVGIRSILELSVLQQLELVDQYFEEVIPKANRNRIDLGNLYLYVLYPGIGARYNSYSDNENLRRFVGQQASTFYNADGTITKASILKGVKKQAEINLNTTITASQNFGAGGGANGAASGLSSGGGGATGISLGTCSEIFPVEFSLKEALTYVGCFSRQILNPMGSSSNLGYPANGMQVNGGSTFTIADFNPTVPICEGCLIYPMKVKMSITSPFCKRRVKNGRTYYHSGTDYDGVLGDEVIAAADGTVVTPLVSGGYHPGLVDIVHEQLGNLLSRSAHIIPSVQPGTKVKQGDVIGKLGPYNNGAEHLHFELRKDKGAGGSARSVEECTTIFLDPALYCRES